jgi:transposase-like protein
MIHCPSCQRPATKRDGYDEQGRQRYGCRPCHRDFTANSTSAFSGYRWPADVILTAVRWYASYPLSATHVMQLLAERHIDVSERTVLNWVQTFGPQLAQAPEVKKQLWGGEFWGKGYFMTTVGQQGNEKVIAMYIRKQGTGAGYKRLHEQPLQLELF